MVSVRTLKIVGAVAGAVLIVASFTSTYRSNLFIGYPRVPNPPQGLVVPYETKAGVVYVTADEERGMRRIFWVQIVSAVVACSVLLIHGGDPFRSR
jgi:hypothetical protein